MMHPMWDSYRITQWWWERPEYYQKITNWARPYHMGLDYASLIPWQKVPCFAVVSWLVRTWFDENWFWNYVVITKWIYQYYYCHLDSISVKWWQQVNEWDEIWIIWNTGNSSWIHLHFWIRENWKWIDPTPLFEKKAENTTKPLYQDIINKTREEEVVEHLFTSYDDTPATIWDVKKLIEIWITRSK